MNGQRAQTDCRLLKTDQEARDVSPINQFEDLANRMLNGVVTPILRSRWRWVLRPFVVTITYTGRRSGKTFSTPVIYRRHDDVVTVRVAAPQAKQWWRNFLGAGAPIALAWHETTITGHGVAQFDHHGRVKVTFILDPARLTR